ncbi:unnamed protein product [Absidia cylindrospora]
MWLRQAQTSLNCRIGLIVFVFHINLLLFLIISSFSLIPTMIKSRKCFFFYPCIFVFLWLKSVYADTVPPTFLQGCDALDHDKTILCFGGTSGSVDVMNQFRPTKQFYSLDISQRLSPNQAKENWKEVPLPSNFELEPRAEFGHAIVNVTNWFITSGAGSGTNYTQPTLVNNTLFYDLKTNEWRTYAPSSITSDPYNANNPISRQLLGVTACTQSNNKSGITPAVFTGGGLSLDNMTMFDFNTSVYHVTSAMDQHWDTLMTEGMEKPGRFLRSFREACAFTDRFRIFTFGGFGYNTTTATHFYNGTDDPNETLTFQQTGFFDIQANTNNLTALPIDSPIPSDRYWHSLTPIPRVGKVIMFGGVFNNAVNRDYCYLFDIDVRDWALCDFGNSTNVPGPRYGHSAVLVGNDTLYILFGADANHQIINDVAILNVTSMRWLNATSNSTVFNAADESSSTSGSSPTLSPGQIAGIVIGVVAGVSLIIVGAVIYYCMWRRKKNAENPDILAAPAFPTLNHHPTEKVIIAPENNNGDNISQVQTDPLLSHKGESVKPAEGPTGAMKPAESYAMKPAE